MKNVEILTRSTPSKPRSGNYPIGSTIVNTGGTTTIVNQGSGGTGADIDIVKENDSRSLSDKNVMSSLRSLAEFISKKNNSSVTAIVDYLNGIKIGGVSVTKLIKQAAELDDYTDTDLMTAARVIAEIKKQVEAMDDIFIHKNRPDVTEYLLQLLGGIEVAAGISTDTLTASGDIAGNNIEATENISGKNITATKKVSAETVVASGAVKGNYVDATEDVSGKNVLASEGVAGKTVTATDTVKGNNVQAVETVSGKNVVASEKVTTLNLLVQALADTYDLNVSHVAMLFRTIVKDYISSEQFIPGFTGNGMKLYKALSGDWNLELDNLTVRKAMTVFELIISKIRAVNGGLVVSPANGKVKSVLLTNGIYRLEIEDDMMFVADDLVRCQSFSVKSGVKYYWVRITSVSGNYIFINSTEFTNSLPAIGDDLVQFGNKTNKARQGLLYLTAAEDGKPRISVLDGVNSTDLTGKIKVILGCLDDIVDSDFPADSQPSGYGLYAQNVFLKGMFILRSGKTVESEFSTTNAALKASQSVANAAATAASAAQTTANNAQTSANGANALLTDIASDNKLTPTEKQSTKKEWDIIVSEKPLNNASAVKFGVVTTAYDTAYSALNTYITPLLASLTTTSNITGIDFRAKFKAYYDARTNLLNSISEKAKSLADAAQNELDNLQIGGRNLLLDSLNYWFSISDHPSDSKRENNKYTVLTNNDTNCYKTWLPITSAQTQYKGTTFTVSLDVKVSNAVGTNSFWLNFREPRISGNSVTLNNTNGAWVRISSTISIPADYSNDSPTGLCGFSSINALGTVIEYRNIKLEIGNKATDWTPAPEDVENRITTVETAFEIREGQISAKVTEVTTKATQAATSATNAKASETAASGSATLAKKSADDAAVILKDVTVKESSITQTAGQIATKVTEVNTKVTEANTAATNAKKSETAAGGSATAASGSAANAKTSADNAAAKLTIITEKESSINQTASQISTKVTEVTKKATEAATSATNAAGSATTAGAKAGEAATSATNAKASADSAAAKLTTITQKESSINQTASNITLQVTEVTTKASQASASAENAANAAELAMAMSQGKMLYRDPSFEKGDNGITVYNNLNNGAVTIARVSGIAGNPNSSGYCLKITTTAAVDPGWGGFAFRTQTKANQVLIIRFIANIPAGRSLGFGTNAIGTGGTYKWLTSINGTGKWQEYAFKVTCGASGTFSTTAHFPLRGGTTPTASAPLIWYLAYATVYDVTDAEVDYIADAAAKYTTKTEHSSSITQLSDKIELKVAKTDFNALGNRVSNAETTITQHTGQIALKAAQSDVTALGTRMSSAEAKITPDAIKLTVKSQTETIASNTVNSIKIGIRNLLIRSNITISANAYCIGSYLFAQKPVLGGRYTLVVCAKCGSNNTEIGLYQDTGYNPIGNFTSKSESIQSFSFTYTSTRSDSYMSFFQMPNGTFSSYVKWAILVEGNIAPTSWTPAPEDIDAKITSVETAFEIREGQISSKVTQATTSATNAKTSETNAAGSASTASSKATAAANSASDAAAKLATITTKETSINQTASQITIQASTVTTKTAEAVNAAELAAAMSKGRMLYRDPTFESGYNGTTQYLGNATRSIVAITGCPNRLAKGLKITATGWSSATDLRIAGFHFGNQSRANAVFVVRIVANIPVGRSIQNYHNAYGTGGTTKWLTSQAGTGKWQEYACKVTCGASGTFSTVNHFALTGGVAPTAAAPVTWYVAYATVFDTTDVDDVPTVDDVKAGLTVTANTITIFGKAIVLTGAVTADTIAANAVTSIKIAANSITANHIQANAIIAAKIAAGVIDATKINVTSIQAAVVTAEKIAALNITTKNLTVTNGAKIGNFLIADGGLYAENTVAIIGMANSSYSTHMSAGQIVIDHPSAGGALIVRGGLCDIDFNVKSYTLRASSIYNAPGVLWAGRINRYGAIESSWGNGAGYVRCSRLERGIYNISHALQHMNYFVLITATPYAEDNSTLNFGMIADKSTSSFNVRMVDAGRSVRDMAFEVCIVGKNV